MQETEETWVRSLGREDPLEEGMAAHSSILAWEMPWTEEPGRLRSVASQSWTRMKRLSTFSYLHLVNRREYRFQQYWLLFLTPWTFLGLPLGWLLIFPCTFPQVHVCFCLFETNISQPYHNQRKTDFVFPTHKPTLEANRSVRDPPPHRIFGLIVLRCSVQS